MNNHNLLINEYFISLGKTEIPTSLSQDEDVKVTINGHEVMASIVKQEYFNNQDGTYNLVYKLKRI